MCTRRCGGDADCPASPNWRCLDPGSLEGARVCACRPLAAEEICGNGVDDDCNGAVDDCQICNGKPIPRDDRDNCGECGNACRGDQICSGGACTCTRATSQECSGVCADLATDAKHCGACGTACPIGQSCVAGACKCPDAASPDLCATGCVDLKSDRSNCGACGTTCVGDQVCRSGKCACPTTEAADLCGEVCVDLATSNTNCGKCGEACPTGTECRAGFCQCPTTVAPDYCAGAGCVSKATDSFHCGACGNACLTGQVCTAGVCACPSGGTVCGSSCVNTATDSRNCGSCGNVCGPGTYCTGGTCQCPSGGTLCSGVCRTTANDAANCGTCGNVCRSGERCALGVCTCDSGLICGGRCVAGDDKANCGACGLMCGGSQACSGGACTCPASGLSPCGLNCVDLKNDAANCGACGNTCRTGEVCSASACVCPSGTRWCDSASACVNTSNNNAHCGACDAACPAATACASSVCRCTDTTKTLCGGVCVDAKTDKTNCGACGTVCSGTKVCRAGSCVCDDPLVGTHVRVTSAPEASVAPSMATNGSKSAVVYLDLRSGRTNIYFTLLEADGTRAGVPDLAVTTYASAVEGMPVALPRVVWAGTRWIVAWPERVNPGSGMETSRVRIRGVTASGALDSLDLKLFSGGSPEGVALAYHPTFGCAVVYNAAYDRVYLQRLGAACDAPETANVVSPGALSGSPYELDQDPNLVIAPTGEYGVLTQGGNKRTAHFIRFNPDGSRTKSVSVLRDLPYNDHHPMLGHDGVTWLTVLLEETVSSPGVKSMVVARGDELATRTRLFGDTTATTDPLHLPRFVLQGGVLELLFTRWPPGPTVKLYFGRYVVPSSLSAAPTPLSSIVDVVGTSNVGPYQGLALLQSGSNLLAGWGDNRWGAFEIYDAVIDRRACP